MNSSFVNILEKMRYPTEKRIQRKKRMTIVPGKSITGENIETGVNDKENIIEDRSIENYTEQASDFFKRKDVNRNNVILKSHQVGNLKKKKLKGSSKRTQRAKKIKKNEFQDSESEESSYSLHDSSSDYETLDDVLLQERISPTLTESYMVGDFLVVEFKTEGKKAETTSNYYVGEVIEVIQTDLDPQYYCKFMRKFTGPKVPEDTFIFPEVDDLSIIEKSMIIQN